MQLQGIIPRDDYLYRVWCRIDLPEVNAAMNTACHCKSEETMLKIQNGHWGEMINEEIWETAIHVVVLDAEGGVAFEVITKTDKDGSFLSLRCFVCLENNDSFFETTMNFPEADDVAEKHGIIIDFESSEERQFFQEALDNRLASAQWEIF